MIYSLVVLIAVLACIMADPNLRAAPKSKFVLGDRTWDSQEEFIKSGKRCATKDATPEQMEQAMKLAAEFKDEWKAEKAATADGKSVLAAPSHFHQRIPVRFHVIQNSTGHGAIAQERIDAQINVLNQAYGPQGFWFDLLSVKKKTNDSWFHIEPLSQEETDMKFRVRQGDEHMLNIYTFEPEGGVLGWAWLPWYILGGFIDKMLDGVVVDHRTLPMGSLYPYNQGHTLTHEVGHWMGLWHTFQGGCEIGYGHGDDAYDTPAEAYPAVGCPVGRDSCPGRRKSLAGTDPVHNFMDYSDDSCLNEFTHSQGRIMRAVWRHVRGKNNDVFSDGGNGQNGGDNSNGGTGSSPKLGPK